MWSYAAWGARNALLYCWCRLRQLLQLFFDLTMPLRKTHGASVRVTSQDFPIRTGVELVKGRGLLRLRGLESAGRGYKCLVKKIWISGSGRAALMPG